MSGFKGAPSTDVAERQARLDLARDSMIQQVLSHPRAEELGVTPEGMENARRYLGGLAKDRSPIGAVARVDGGDHVVITEQTYVNGHGEAIQEGWRKNGPRWEKVRIAEEKIDPRTTLVSRRLR